MTGNRTLSELVRAAVAATLLAALPATLAACTEKNESGGSGAIAVTATDTSCEVAKNTVTTGNTTYAVTNNGTKVTEFYVYAEGDRVVGEVENIGPGLTRQLIVAINEPGKYQTACKPGMVGDGIRNPLTAEGDAIKTGDTGKLADAAAGYKRYVTSQTAALVDTTARFVAAVKAGDLDAAKAQFPTTRTYYERVEPVAEDFPDDLDPRLDLREADVEPGAKWTGFHRIEKDLWTQGPQPDTNEVADQLLADVKELDDGVNAADFRLDPIQTAGGAARLLEEIARTKITGEEDFFSHTDLWDFKANVEGSQAAVAAVRPILDEQHADLGRRIDQRFADVEAELEQYRDGDRFVAYDTVAEPQRQILSQLLDALLAEVSNVQGAVAG